MLDKQNSCSWWSYFANSFLELFLIFFFFTFIIAEKKKKKISPFYPDYLHQGKNFGTYTRCCTHFFYIFWRISQCNYSYFWMEGWTFVRLIKSIISPIQKSFKCRKYIPFSFVWLTHILSTAWPKSKRKIRVTAKIHIIWFFSLNGLLSAKNIQIYGKAESMFNMT